MQFHVPQFIDVEDKIFGPLSFRQFVYLIGGAGFCVILYALIPYRVISLPFIAIVASFSLALSFYEVNGKPFIYTVQAAFSYITNSHLYLWQRTEHKDKSKKQIEKEAEEIQRVVVNMSSDQSTGSRLADKAFSVDVGEDNQASEEKEPKHTSPNRSPS
ncbi:MAG: PrgI family protein [Candidatus Paceibacterota bacterium]